jgi:hypothetical protein
MTELLFLAGEDGIVVHPRGCRHVRRADLRTADEWWHARCRDVPEVLERAWKYFAELDASCTLEDAAEWTDILSCCNSCGNLFSEKVQRFVDTAREHGWSVAFFSHEEVQARRGIELVMASWCGGRWDAEYAYYDIAGSERGLPNLAAAERILEKPPFVGGFRKSVPFDPDGATDDEILDACTDKTLTWLNTLTNDTETARMPPDDRNPRTGRRYHEHTKFTETTAGRRVLTFVDANGTGFRSVALDSLLRVTG